MFITTPLTSFGLQIGAERICTSQWKWQMKWELLEVITKNLDIAFTLIFFRVSFLHLWNTMWYYNVLLAYWIPSTFLFIYVFFSHFYIWNYNVSLWYYNSDLKIDLKQCPSFKLHNRKEVSSYILMWSLLWYNEKTVLQIFTVILIIGAPSCICKKTAYFFHVILKSKHLMLSDILNSKPAKISMSCGYHCCFVLGFSRYKSLSHFFVIFPSVQENSYMVVYLQRQMSFMYAF
jgi:hypothetical protein